MKITPRGQLWAQGAIWGEAAPDSLSSVMCTLVRRPREESEQTGLEARAAGATERASGSG